MNKIDIKKITYDLIDTFLNAGQIGLPQRSKGCITPVEDDVTNIISSILSITIFQQYQYLIILIASTFNDENHQNLYKKSSFSNNIIITTLIFALTEGL